MIRAPSRYWIRSLGQRRSPKEETKSELPVPISTQEIVPASTQLLPGGIRYQGRVTVNRTALERMEAYLVARPISFTRRLVGCAANEKVVCACYDPRRWQSPYSAGISTSSSPKADGWERLRPERLRRPSRSPRRGSGKRRKG